MTSGLLCDHGAQACAACFEAWEKERRAWLQCTATAEEALKLVGGKDIADADRYLLVEIALATIVDTFERFAATVKVQRN